MNRFTLHIRLTKRCNAECDYCSSYQNAPLKYMSVKDFKKSIDYFVESILPIIGLDKKGTHIAVQYVGGEILTIPKHIIKECVFYARKKLGLYFHEVIDGVQSNLIANSQQVIFLHNLFRKNIGTSVDNFSDMRKVGNSSDKYREIYKKSTDELYKRRRFKPPVIFVVDQFGIMNMHKEIELSKNNGTDITLRAAFPGGSKVAQAMKSELALEYGKAFDNWILKSNIRIEPFYQLLVSRLSSVDKSKSKFDFYNGCPFQRNCSKVSLDIEPNGDLYTCLDMADSNQFKLGNSLDKTFDIKIWKMLSERQNIIDDKCKSCKWFDNCQGGCMSEAIHHDKGVYGRTELCEVWETIFNKIDKTIEKYGTNRLILWVKEIG